MNHDFWHTKWNNGEIGFHQNEINAHLEQYWKELGLKRDDKVFVPLSGKSRDMIWLAEQGHKVISVELSTIATEAFFIENDLSVKTTDKGNFVLYESDNIQILCGDFFNLATAELKGIRGVYDRASLVALPPEMRRTYADHLRKILPNDVRILLVALEYNEKKMSGPPFSVDEKEIRELYGPEFGVELMFQCDVIEEYPSFKKHGLTQLLEKVYCLR